MRILIDMDEVLADFVGGVCKEWEIGQDQLLAHWPVGTWDFVEHLAKALRRQGREEGALLTPNRLWQQLSGRSWFWQALPVLPWARDVMAVVTSLTADWFVVSSPSHCEFCHVGKIRWLRKFFDDPLFDRFMLTPHKSAFARSDTVLIDDREETVSKFMDAGGGGGVVFPRHHNSFHARAAHPVEYMVEQLGGLSCRR